MSKKSKTKRSRNNNKSETVAIRKSYVYAGVAALAILVIAAVVFLSTSPNTAAVAPTATSDVAEAASNAESIIEAISPAQYQEQFGDGKADHLLLDVRTPDEFVSGHIEGAANLNVETLADNLDQVPKDKPIVVYCRSGNRSKVAQGILVEAGYPVVYDLGGIIDWQAQGYAVTQ